MFWDLMQELDLRELRQRIDRMQEGSAADFDLHRLAAEVAETELRVNLLVKLLIAKGLITAEEYARVLSAARSGVATETPGTAT